MTTHTVQTIKYIVDDPATQYGISEQIGLPELETCDKSNLDNHFSQIIEKLGHAEYCIHKSASMPPITMDLDTRICAIEDSNRVLKSIAAILFPDGNVPEFTRAIIAHRGAEYVLVEVIVTD